MLLVRVEQCASVESEMPSGWGAGGDEYDGGACAVGAARVREVSVARRIVVVVRENMLCFLV